MPTLLLRFPAGRYHATPWGHHVNEGLVEWPPCPWRLLRALIATGYATLGWSEPLPPVARALVTALASTLPRYRLPEASVAHSRHFMPTTKLEKGREKTTLVFDAWANVGDGVLAVRWNCALDAAARELFETLARNLGYLGRSESWVLADAPPDDAPLPPGDDVAPHEEGMSARPGREQISLMAPLSAEEYGRWRFSAVAEALALHPLPEGKKKPPKKLLDDRRKAERPYPVELIDALQLDTAWWRGFGWSQPPGSRRALYWRRSDALAVTPPVRPPVHTLARVPAILLALTTPSGITSALPPRTRALPQGELLHRALVARADGGRRVPCPELTGLDSDRRPLRDHQHAHFLSLDLDGDRRIDHMLVHAPMGLGPDAQRAIRSLKRTFVKGSVGELCVAVAGSGGLEDLRSLTGDHGRGMERILGPRRGATSWRSFTPFVPPRHLKRRGRNALEGQVNAELTSRGLPSATVSVLPWDDAGGGDEDGIRDLRHAVRVRQRGGRRTPPIDVGFALALTFDRPVCGPIAIGYGAHFGLGLFSASLG